MSTLADAETRVVTDDAATGRDPSSASPPNRAKAVKSTGDGGMLDGLPGADRRPGGKHRGVNCAQDI